MKTLSPETRALLEAARSAHDPSDADRARVRSAVAAAVAAGAATAATATAVPAAASAAAGVGSVTVASTAAGSAIATASVWKIAVVATIVAAGSGTAVWTYSQRRGPEPRAKVEHSREPDRRSVPVGGRRTAPGASRLAGAPVAASEITAPPSAASPAFPPPSSAAGRLQIERAEESEATPDRSPTGTPERPRSTPPSAGTEAAPPSAPAGPLPPTPAPLALQGSQPSSAAAPLGAETELLRGARIAERDGRLAEALHALDRHQAEYPRGLLVREREVLRAVVLCKLGRRQEGRAVAQRLGGSVLAARVRSACGETDP